MTETPRWKKRRRRQLCNSHTLLQITEILASEQRVRAAMEEREAGAGVLDLMLVPQGDGEHPLFVLAEPVFHVDLDDIPNLLIPVEMTPL